MIAASHGRRSVSTVCRAELPVAYITIHWLPVDVETLENQEFEALQLLVLAGGDQRTNDFAEEHFLAFPKFLFGLLGPA
jgi:hypothetical protein